MRQSILPALGLLAALIQPAAAQTLRVGLPDDIDLLDPTTARTYTGRIVFAGLCDKLFDITEKLEIVPQLAAAYEWTDPKTLVLTLREGVTFHDGEKLDAEAVAYSLQRHLTMQGSFRRSEINTAERFEVLNPTTVRVVMREPFAPFVAQLTDRAGMIVSPKAAESAGKDFALRPVCAGPFRFVERVPQDRIVLARFADYWNKGAIHVDRVIYQPITDTSVRLANLQAGALDLAPVVPSDVAAVRRNPRLKLLIWDWLGYQSIAFNLGNGPRARTPLGQEARVRRAFSLSLDRQAIIDVVYEGMYTATAQAVPPANPFHVPSVKPPARDVAKARALLQEAGVQAPFPMELMITNSPDNRQVAEVIQSMARDAGFDVKIVQLDTAAALAAEQRGDYDAFYLFWSGRVDPDGNIYPFLHSNTNFNAGKYANPDVDALLERARSVTGRAERIAAYERMWQIVQQDVPIIYTWHPKHIWALNTRLSGLEPVPDGLIRLQGLRLN